jgi:hypothetical protein
MIIFLGLLAEKHAALEDAQTYHIDAFYMLLARRIVTTIANEFGSMRVSVMDAHECTILGN